MQTYSTTEVFKNLNRLGKRVNLTIKTNGGSVTLNSFIGGAWSPAAPPIIADGRYELLIDDEELQVVPTGGAIYTITE